MEDIFAKLYDMTAFSNIIADPSFLVMYAIAFILLYLGIKKHYEPLLLVPIAFGVLIANFPGGEMGVIHFCSSSVSNTAFGSACSVLNTTGSFRFIPIFCKRFRTALLKPQ